MSFSLIVTKNNASIKITNMDSETLISDVKFLICFFTGFPAVQQKIFYNDVLLMNEKFLGDYEIFGDSLITLQT